MDSYVLLCEKHVSNSQKTTALTFTYVAQADFGATNTTVHADSKHHDEIMDMPKLPTSCLATTEEASIAKFLERKVRIYSNDWVVGANFDQSINVWDLFLSDPNVANKLQNYSLIRGDLKVTILLNGTPFHVGLLVAGYSYMYDRSQDSATGFKPISISQRKHLWLNASTCKGGVICCPFISPWNYMRLQNPETFGAPDRMGRIDIVSIRNLEELSAGTDDITLTIFAQMYNVELAGPTMAPTAFSGSSDVVDQFFYTAQSAKKKGKKDEYQDDGVISGPASTVASIAGKLSTAPYIGPYAMATSLGAGAIAEIARLFGFSRPTEIRSPTPMRNFPVSNMSLGEGADTSQKMSLTAKQEISIDPRTVDMPPVDEMSLMYIAQKESFITSFAWSTLNGVDVSIFSMRVNPMAEERVLVAPEYKIIPTALSFVTRPFTSWSGTLRYRFQAICSQFHRGRIAIVYDPVGLSPPANIYNATFNTIIDLEEGRDVTIEIPWQQPGGYAEVNVDASLTTFYDASAPAAVTANPEEDNGVFYAVVVNELVSPDASSQIYFAVSISAGDDFELMNPGGRGLRFQEYAPQSGISSCVDQFFYVAQAQASSTEVVPEDENAPEGEENVVQMSDELPNTTMSSLKAKVWFGEKPASIRQLCKRYCFHRCMGETTSGTALMQANVIFPSFPISGGYDPNGGDQTATATPFWYCGPDYLNYFKRAYACWRGSIRWKFVSSAPANCMRVLRRSGVERAGTITYNWASASIVKNDTQSYRAYHQGEIFYFGNNWSGTALTQNRSQDALEVEIPYVNDFRCSKTFPGTSSSNTRSAAYPYGDMHYLVVTSQPTDSFNQVEAYVAAGDDFSFFGFNNAPVFYTMDWPAAT